MEIKKAEYTTLKAAALKAAENLQEIAAICAGIEARADAASQKAAAYITEKRKNNKFYCR